MVVGGRNDTSRIAVVTYIRRGGEGKLPPWCRENVLDGTGNVFVPVDKIYDSVSEDHVEN